MTKRIRIGAAADLSVGFRYERAAVFGKTVPFPYGKTLYPAGLIAPLLFGQDVLKDVLNRNAQTPVFKGFPRGVQRECPNKNV